MHFIIAVIFTITVFLAFIEDYLDEAKKLIILGAYILLMVVLASTKSIEHTADAIGYEEMFKNNDDMLIEFVTEPTYIYLSRIVMACGGTVVTMFVIYALISIPAKMVVLYKFTPYIFTALIVYIPVYFTLHDLIQIRAAAAAMFMLATMLALVKKRYILVAVLFVCGVLFHYSAVAYLPLLLIGNRRLNKTWRIVIGCMFPVAFAMYVLKMDLFSFIPSALTYGKLDFYKEASDKGEWDAIWLYDNIYYIAKVLMLYLCLIYYDYLADRIPHFPLFLNVFAASIIFLASMATIPVVAGRISDMFAIVDCIVFTFSIYLCSPRYLARICVTLAALWMMVHNIIYTEYFT